MTKPDLEQLRRKAVIMARYSSDNQTELSIEGQLEVCRKFAQDYNYTIVNEYIDRAVSGRHVEKREAFQQMIKDASKREFEAVIVYKLDRFARNKEDSVKYKALLRQFGVKVVSATQMIPDVPEGVIFEALIEGYDEYYSLELAQKVLRTFKIKRREGKFLGGRIPYGYKIVDHEYIIDEEEAANVRYIFEEYNKGKSISQISKELHESILDYDKVRKILLNKKYYGALEHCGEEIEDVIPAIIDKGTFLLANKNLKERTRSKVYVRSTDILSLPNVVHCGICNQPLVCSSGTSAVSKNRYYYYKCRCGCTLKPINAFKMEDDIYNNIIYHISKNAVYIANKSAEIIEKGSEGMLLNQLKKKLAAVKRKLTNIYDAIEDTGYKKEYKARIEALEAEQKQIENAIKGATGMQVSKEQILEYMTSLTKGKETNPEFRHELLLSIVEYVSVDNEKVIVVCKNNKEKANDVLTDTKFAISALGEGREANYELKVYKHCFVFSFARRDKKAA